MVSAKNEEDTLQHDDEHEANGKRRRVQRACDVCRKKKIRCDGLQPEKGACSNCASYGFDCTFADAVKRRAPPRSYVIALEARMEKAEEVITRLAPFIDINKALGPMPQLPSDKKEGAEGDSQAVNATTSNHQIEDQIQGITLPTTNGLNYPHANATTATFPLAFDVPEVSHDYYDYDEEEEDEDAAYLHTQMRNVALEDAGGDNEALIATVRKNGSSDDSKYFAIEPPGSTGKLMATSISSETPLQFLGRASTFHLLPLLDKKMSQMPNTSGISMASCDGSEMSSDDIIADALRSDNEDLSKYNIAWPSHELKNKLLDAYFKRSNRDFPVLNEVVTRRTLSKPSSQWKDAGTIGIALGVFAIASRHCPEISQDTSEGGVSGPYWFRVLTKLQSDTYPRQGTSLMFLQGTVLSIIFMSAVPKSASVHAWVALSAVVRMLEDCGAHRKFTSKRLGHSLLTEETYKRLWWVTYVLDRQLSCDLGRPMAVQDEDFDLDEILLVDDDILVQASESKTQPIQPPGKLCDFAGFLQWTRLTQIVGKTLRTIYAISKSKISRGFMGRKWDALVVADIDRCLGHWLEEVPSALKYNSEETNEDILLQSSRTFIHYYYTQTLIHRPFIQSEKMENSDLAFKSLSIVSNASRSAIHILDNLLQKGLISKMNADIPVRVFTFGCMLLLISWSASVRNLRVSNSVMDDVRKCLDILDGMRHLWSLANLLHRLLELIIQRSAVPFSTGMLAQRPTNKRHQQGDLDLNDLVPSLSNTQDQQSKDEVSPRSFAQLPKNTSRRMNKQLPFSTQELQTGFTSNSPETASSKSTSPPLQHALHPAQTLSNSASSSSTAPRLQNQNRYASQSNFGNTWSGITPSSSNPIQSNQVFSHAHNFPTRIDSTSQTNVAGTTDPTIFDPAARSLDMLFGNNGMPSEASNTIGNDQSGSSAYDGLYPSNGLGSMDPQSIMSGGNSMGDPLDALMNMQTLWSDADWMRVLDG